MQEVEKRVECQRFSPVTFRIGVDERRIELLRVRVEDAWRRFTSSPVAGIAASLEKEVLATGIYGTHTIEGGDLSEEETSAILETGKRTAGANATAVLNLRSAYEYAGNDAAAADWLLSPQYICKVHELVTQDLPHEYNRPGEYRDNRKDLITRVGNPAYKPPQYIGDIVRCVEGLCTWHAELTVQGIPALIRAPLVHYYYEIIHPFWDGNGRVGRVLEASILVHDGMVYAPFAQARYYLDQIDRYFSLFTATRQAGKAKRPDANTDFVCFFLEGMLKTINNLHDRVNHMTKILLFSFRLSSALRDKTINQRQFQILKFIQENPGLYTRKMLAGMPWYQALYQKVTDRTLRRDWLVMDTWLDVTEGHYLYPKI